MIDGLWRLALRVAHRLLRGWWWLRRPEAFGAYVAVWCDDRLLVIRNSYKPGVTLPCGALDRNEAPREGASRELREEVGIDLPAATLREAGLVILEHLHRLDHGHFFEVTLAAEPAVEIDRREVVWAAFVAEQELAALPLVPHLREYLRRRSERPLTQ